MGSEVMVDYKLEQNRRTWSVNLFELTVVYLFCGFQWIQHSFIHSYYGLALAHLSVYRLQAPGPLSIIFALLLILATSSLQP